MVGFDLGADGNFNGSGNYRFDSDDHILFQVQVDGGGYTTVLAFESDQPTGFNDPLAQDTNLDGVGNGVQIVPGFATFSASVANGTTLDIRILVEMDGANEEIGFDNILVTGDLIPEPGTGLLVLLAIGLAGWRRRRG